MIPPHTKAIPLNRLPVVRKHGEALFLPRRRRDNEIPVKSGRRTAPLCPARRPMPAEPDAALPPRSAPRSEHAARCECSVSETPRAAADRGAAAPRKTSPLPAPPGQRDGQLCEKASPGFSPPHAASRTFSTTKENVRSDAHYVGKTGLRLSRAVFPSSPLPRAKKRPRSNPDRGRSACCFFKPRRCTARRCRG